jgi:tripartite-type tricarboxylate transporter receptor subunit TctC
MGFVRTNVTRWGLAIAMALAAATAAGAQEPYFKNKQIRLVVGSDTGAGYDAYARLLARHISRHIPGAPAIVVQNMPGAGGLVAANYLFNIAAKDGTVIGSFQRDLPLQSLLDRERTQIKFDATQFTWLGSSSSGAGDAYLMLVRSDVPVHSVEDLRGPNARQILIAATAQGAQSYDVPLALGELLGLNVRVVGGYPSAAALSLAMMRKEVDARMIGFSSLRATQPEWLRDGVVRVLIQFGRIDRHKDLANVPTARELARNEQDRDLIEMMETSQFLSWPFTAPPGIPADVTAVLRTAFMDTQRDPEYVADAEKAKMELSPIDGEQITKLLVHLNSVPASTIERYLRIIGKPSK